MKPTVLTAEGPPYFEKIEGKIIDMPSPTDIHQLCLGLLYAQLLPFALSKGYLILAPFDVHLSAETVVQPDMLFVFHERYSRLIGADRKLHGSPDWVAEVVSPTSERYDRVTKAELYFRYGIKEYWLICPESRTVEIGIPGSSGFNFQQVTGPEIVSELWENVNIKTEDLFRF